MRKCGIYLLRNRESGRVYVGQSVDIDRRWIKHKADALRGDKKTKLLDAIRSYGPDAFELCVLELCSREELNERETHWIAETDALANGYNHLSGGGQGARDLCPETRERYRVAQLGKKRSEEAKARTSASLRGRKLSAEARANMSKGMMGRVFSDSHKENIRRARAETSPEARAKLSAAQSGKPASQEARARMSAAHKGVPKSPEHRAAIAAAMRGNKNRASSAN